MGRQKGKFDLGRAERLFRGGLNEGEVARKFGLKRSTFVYHYKKASGETPIELKNELMGEVIENSKKSLGEKPYKKVLKESGISDTHFRALFEKMEGKTPKQYEKEVWIKKARIVLANHGFVREAQEATGYKYASHFGKDFKELMGMTPTRYKDRLLVRGMKRLLGEMKPGREVFKEFEKWSDSYLKFIFKKLTGITPKQYQCKVLAEMAKELLLKYKPGVVWKRVAGNRSDNFFYDNFKKEVRMTPGEYRRMAVIEESKLLIPKIDTLSEVYEEFECSMNYLNEHFKKSMKMTPGKYGEYAKQVSKFMSRYCKSPELRNSGLSCLPA